LLNFQTEQGSDKVRTLPPGIHIFCYHGIVDKIHDPLLERNFMPVERFREQIMYFREYSMISLAELENALSAPESRQPRIVITIDDGHRSALQMHAILADLQVPWTLFVSTGIIEQPQPLWTAELSLLILYGSRRKVDILSKQWSLESRAQRESAYALARRRLKQLPASEKDHWLATLRAQYPAGETQNLLEAFPSFKVMSWDEIRSLQHAGVTIGSHGVTHEIHHARQDASIREKELERSKAEIEARLGAPCAYFAFPNGNAHPQSPSELASAGYRLGLTTDERAVGLNENPFLLPRLNPCRL
jgi:peptidoglycan/xylan/chitin deacetylase (PgdA/CDA1 family)